jgi:hypothetical protein
MSLVTELAAGDPITISNKTNEDTTRGTYWRQDEEDEDAVSSARNKMVGVSKKGKAWRLVEDGIVDGNTVRPIDDCCL